MVLKICQLIAKHSKLTPFYKMASSLVGQDSSSRSQKSAIAQFSLQTKANPASTQLEHLCQINVNRQQRSARKSGIICTLGPASRSVEMVKKLIISGMTIARLNFSHGTHEYHGTTIDQVRKAVDSFPIRPVIGIALDTKGPEIRTGVLASGVNAEIELKEGEKICVSTNDSNKDKCTTSLLYVDYKNITKVLRTGTRIFIDDGLISLVVEKIENENISCVIENGGMLGSKKGVNLLGSNVDLPAVSQKDVEDLRFGVSKKVDMIFASFIRNAEGVRIIRKHLGEDGKHIKVIAKVENQEGLDNIDEIIQESDGLMVARGDLGIEIPSEKVFLAQKMMIAKCNLVGKPVICATQMLESMTKKPRPTRAEGTDVANAILDGADCVMLSGETAKGDYPVETVHMMHEICREAENIVYHLKTFEELNRLTAVPTDTSHALALSCVYAAISCQASAILALSVTAGTLHIIAKYRPPCPILCIVENEGVCRQLLLYRGIVPLTPSSTTDFVIYPQNSELPKDIEERIKFGLKIAKERNYVRTGENVAIFCGSVQGSNTANSFRMISASKEYGF